MKLIENFGELQNGEEQNSGREQPKRRHRCRRAHGNWQPISVTVTQSSRSTSHGPVCVCFDLFGRGGKVELIQSENGLAGIEGQEREWPFAVC